MTDDRRQRIEQIYLDALDIPAADRPALLDRACEGDRLLRGEVEALLALQSGAETFLEQPAIESAARTLADILPAPRPPEIAGYKIIRHLGEGGMGLVYLAEQESPLRRLVALKLIKPGMDTRQVVARFETERQALALMDHPNIAAVFDAGSTKEGRPYFVMEYVDGVSITDYCDRQRLSTHDRLALFVQVCAAVQHAHQKGVIHRDLKPSNVLVTERDGQPLPKVIDFGTAKAVGAAWNATATQGGQGMVLGTLEYMSPEQAALSADIDTATDVYSLGVLLYELLVGRLPFDTDELRAAGYDEIRRIIRESDPPKPSVRAEQPSDKSGVAARARQTDAPGLTRQLRGDLDWITLKALEKDRTRRYSTVAAFATDIGRFLGDQPVEARPPSSTYRIRKFTRRHRLPVAAAAIILTILVAAVAVTGSLYWQVRAALRESTYLAYTATLAAASGDLRNDAAPQARARLLTVPETERGWEWQHLFIQADGSVFNFASAAPPCQWLPWASMTTALSLDADAMSIVLRRCSTLERWSVTTFAHTSWSAPPRSGGILAENSRGQMLWTDRQTTLPALGSLTEPPSYNLVLTDRARSTAAVAFGPFPRNPKCADISPDGTHIAIGLAEPMNTAREDVFEVWNAVTGRIEFRLVAAPPALPDMNSQVRWCVIQFSPDSRRIATSGARVYVWDAATGVARVADSLVAGFYPQAIEFSPSGERLAIGRKSGLVDVLDLAESSAILRRLSDTGLAVEASTSGADRSDTDRFLRRGREVLAVAFSPDGQTVVSASSTNVGVWDIGQSTLVRVLSGHAFDVVDVVVSADGRRIYSVDTSGVVRGWPSSGTSAVVRTPGSVESVRPFPMFTVVADGAVIATATSDHTIATVRLADLNEEVIRTEVSGLNPAISPDGRHVFVGEIDEGATIRRWELESRETVAVSSIPINNCKYTAPIPKGSKTFVAHLTVSPQSALLAFAHASCVAVWDASTMKQLAVFGDATAHITHLLFRDDETLIISSQGRNPNVPALIRLWNWRTNRVLAAVEPRPAVGPQHVIERLASSPDGQRIALTSFYFQTSTVSIWNGTLKAEVGKLPPGDYQALAFSPDGRRIVSVGSKETAVRVWDAERLLPLLTLSDTDSHRGVAFTAAGQIVAGRTNGGLTIWDTQIRRR